MRANRSLGVLLVLLGGCRDAAPQKSSEQLDVVVQHDHAVDLAVYTSFEVILPTTMVDEQPPTNFAELEQPLAAALAEQLIDKGLIQSADGPQLIINPLIAVDDDDQALDFYDNLFGWYWGYAHPWAMNAVLPRGSLVIDVIDQADASSPSDDKLIYRGVVRGLLAEDPEQIRLELGDAIWAIFADWPAREPS